MALQMNKHWLFEPPKDGVFDCETIPDSFGDVVSQLITKISSQGEQKSILERYKRSFSAVGGMPYAPSSDFLWAKTDLDSAIGGAQRNAPAFLVAFYNTSEELGRAGFGVPSDDYLNSLLSEHNIGFYIKQGQLLLREVLSPVLTDVPQPSTPNINEVNRKLIEKSLTRSAELIDQGYGKEAIQESLWLLETIVTGFKGTETESGKVEGKYFNQIVKELKKERTDTVFTNVLSWIGSFHGFLSSPTGGGVRHGTDLETGLEISNEEARLYFNLIRSYTNYLLFEYNRRLFER